MPVLRIGLGVLVVYAGLVILAWLFQERLAFPAPRNPVPDPRGVGVANGARIELVMRDGTKLAGWYLAPHAASASPGGGGSPPLGPAAGGSAAGAAPALLWFYGNGETIATIWPILRDLQPPGSALLVADYPGYGGSGGRASEAGIYEAADVAYAALAARPGVDPRRIYVYGRSLGSAPATYVATRHPVAGLILESPFTNAADMARHAYAILPRFILRLELDNLARIKQVRCPVLLFHGTADRLVPTAMGLKLAAAASESVEVVLIQGSGHNETYAWGGTAYRDKLWAFVAGPRPLK
jgi:fermentation-respiration switch protein FrsA (DUF1100 family)